MYYIYIHIIELKNISYIYFFYELNVWICFKIFYRRNDIFFRSTGIKVYFHYYRNTIIYLIYALVKYTY